MTREQWDKDLGAEEVVEMARDLRIDGKVPLTVTVQTIREIFTAKLAPAKPSVLQKALEVFKVRPKKTLAELELDPLFRLKRRLGTMMLELMREREERSFLQEELGVALDAAVRSGYERSTSEALSRAYKEANRRPTREKMAALRKG